MAIRLESGGAILLEEGSNLLLESESPDLGTTTLAKGPGDQWSFLQKRTRRYLGKLHPTLTIEGSYSFHAIPTASFSPVGRLRSYLALSARVAFTPVKTTEDFYVGQLEPSLDLSAQHWLSVVGQPLGLSAEISFTPIPTLEVARVLALIPSLSVASPHYLQLAWEDSLLFSLGITKIEIFEQISGILKRKKQNGP